MLLETEHVLIRIGSVGATLQTFQNPMLTSIKFVWLPPPLWQTPRIQGGVKSNLSLYLINYNGEMLSVPAAPNTRGGVKSNELDWLRNSLHPVTAILMESSITGRIRMGRISCSRTIRGRRDCSWSLTTVCTSVFFRFVPTNVRLGAGFLEVQTKHFH